jgi:hypothetical protein
MVGLVVFSKTYHPTSRMGGCGSFTAVVRSRTKGLRLGAPFDRWSDAAVKFGFDSREGALIWAKRRRDELAARAKENL